MGIFSTIFGGSGQAGKVAQAAKRESYFTPYNISGPFGGVSSTQAYIPNAKEWKKGMRPQPGTFTANLSPEMAKFREALINAGMGELGGMGQGVPGYAGITPEMFQEFMMANNNQGQDWMNQSRGYLDEERGMGPYDFQGTYNDRLANMRAQDQPREDRLRYNNWDNQFGRGILDSTGGQYQTQGVEEAFGNQDLRRHDTAFGQAMGLGDQYNQIRQMLQQAGLNFGQAGQSQVSDRFARANEMFGTGQQAESLRANRAGGFLQGAGSIDQFLANLMQMSGNLGSQRSQNNLASFGPQFQSAQGADQRGAQFAGQLINGASSLLNPSSLFGKLLGGGGG